MLLALMIQIKFASAQLSACHNNKSQICRLSSPPVGAVCNNKHVTATQPSLLLLLLLIITHERFQTVASPKSITEENTAFQ